MISSIPGTFRHLTDHLSSGLQGATNTTNCKSLTMKRREQKRLEKELERDTELAKRVAVGFMGFAALGYAYLHYFGWPF